MFGAGANVGAAVTEVPLRPSSRGRWRLDRRRAGLRRDCTAPLMGVAFWFFTDEDSVVAERRRTGVKPPSALGLNFEPLKNAQFRAFCSTITSMCSGALLPLVAVVAG